MRSFEPIRIHTRMVIDMITWEVLEDEAFDWCGPVAHLKGDGTAKDQLALNNQLVQSQLAIQKGIRDKITAGLDKYLTGAGEGFDPAQMGMMISQFLNQNDANFNQAGQSVIASLNARGGGGGALPVGGDFTRGLEDLQGARATSQSQGVLGVNVANLQQALQNRFNAANVESGQAAQIGQNVSTFSGAASNSLDQYVKAANTGFGSAFTTAFGSALGKGLGSGVAGATGNAISNIPGVSFG